MTTTTMIITSGVGIDCSFGVSDPINCFGCWWSIGDDNDYSVHLMCIAYVLYYRDLYFIFHIVYLMCTSDLASTSDGQRHSTGIVRFTNNLKRRKNQNDDYCDGGDDVVDDKNNDDNDDDDEMTKLHL